MRLSQRIHDICNCVERGESVADVGTDHAYVPMLLLKNGISPFAIMSDISEGSLKKAKETFDISKIFIDESNFRIGDGLETLKTGEVNDLIIAGLGGHTIINILDADISKSKSFKKLILQPRKFSGNLRYYLFTHGWDIIKEVLTPEGKFVCEIIVAVPTNNNVCKPEFIEDDIRWKYPESLLYANRKLLKKKINWKINSISEEILNLNNSKKDNTILNDKLNSDIKYLQDFLTKIDD